MTPVRPHKNRSRRLRKSSMSASFKSSVFSSPLP